MKRDNFTDTLEDFANNPYQIGSVWPYGELIQYGYGERALPNPVLLKMSLKYGTYNNDIDGAYAKLGSGTYSLLESKVALNYLIRDRFTNK